MNLVFLFLCFGCKNDTTENISIQWEKEKAVKLVIPKSLAGNDETDKVKVLLAGSNGPSILGEVKVEGNSILFQPLIPFTRGLNYKVEISGKTIGVVEVPQLPDSQRPSVILVFPTDDTLPENLLKVHILFTHPMREGEALSHIALVKNEKDTLSDVFLDLQPELWSNDSRTLTLWLDPGRIKRDLQPNLLLGSPLTKGDKYTLIIKEKWPDQYGSELHYPYITNFVAGPRDSICPDPSKWKVEIPKSGTKEPFKIQFDQPVDQILAENAIHILDDKGNELPVFLGLTNPIPGITLVPDSTLKKGDYYLMVEARLEDYAGNNLDHPFDNDLTQKQNKNQGKNYKRLLKVE